MRQVSYGVAEFIFIPAKDSLEIVTLFGSQHNNHAVYFARIHVSPP